VKSRKRSESTQLEEPPVFFLDRTFGKTQLAEMLRAADFCVVTHHEEYGERGMVGDPAIIADCGAKNRILLTGDQDMVFTYALEIKKAGIAVFVTTESNEGPAQWGPRIIAAKKYIWRELERRRKPFTARISHEGRVSQVRVFEGNKWRAVNIPRKNPPHESKYKANHSLPPEIRGSDGGRAGGQAGAEEGSEES
jgi:predicted nuclease of predicted toxin-antitoxin system